MCLTEKEIYSQNDSLKKTCDWFLENEKKIRDVIEKINRKKIIFLGCGSSYMLGKSGAFLFSKEKEFESYSIAGGDFLEQPEDYRNMVDHSVIFVISRSGMTSEIIESVKILSANHDVKMVVLTMNPENPLMDFADLAIVLPWAYDHSVCQTRTVTNIYYSLLILRSFFTRQPLSAIKKYQGMLEGQKKFMDNNRSFARDIASRDFDNVVILADSILCGIAEEASLAFTEISMVSGQYFPVLDYRHGPKVLNNQKTLTIVALRESASRFQLQLVEDVAECGGTVVVLSSGMLENPSFLSLHAAVESFDMMGIFLINLCQMIALEKAVIRGVNPDKPEGLDAYIEL